MGHNKRRWNETNKKEEKIQVFITILINRGKWLFILNLSLINNIVNRVKDEIPVYLETLKTFSRAQNEWINVNVNFKDVFFHSNEF